LLCFFVFALGCSKINDTYTKSITYQYQAWDSQHIYYITYPTKIITTDKHYPISRIFVLTIDTIAKIAILNNDTFYQNNSTYTKSGQMGIPFADFHFLSFKDDTLMLKHWGIINNTEAQEANISAYRISAPSLK
ncbi:MAG: hypothetical protein JST52_12430, partial [Bacteroidetes bacterium]|nr:hypothetical protein [Bacteroidota bacterium]